MYARVGPVWDGHLDLSTLEVVYLVAYTTFLSVQFLVEYSEIFIYYDIPQFSSWLLDGLNVFSKYLSRMLAA